MKVALAKWLIFSFSACASVAAVGSFTLGVLKPEAPKKKEVTPTDWWLKRFESALARCTADNRVPGLCDEKDWDLICSGDSWWCS